MVWLNDKEAFRRVFPTNEPKRETRDSFEYHPRLSRCAAASLRALRRADASAPSCLHGPAAARQPGRFRRIPGLSRHARRAERDRGRGLRLVDCADPVVLVPVAYWSLRGRACAVVAGAVGPDHG